MPSRRRLAFGEVAELYDEVRPSYPAELVEDVIALAPLDGDAPRALEVGAGTGKATVLFAQRGLSDPCARAECRDGGDRASATATAFRHASRSSARTSSTGSPAVRRSRSSTRRRRGTGSRPTRGYAKARSVLDAGRSARRVLEPAGLGVPARCATRSMRRTVARSPERTADDPMHPAAGERSGHVGAGGSARSTAAGRARAAGGAHATRGRSDYSTRRVPRAAADPFADTSCSSRGSARRSSTRSAT